MQASATATDDTSPYWGTARVAPHTGATSRALEILTTPPRATVVSEVGSTLGRYLNTGEMAGLVGHVEATGMSLSDRRQTSGLREVCADMVYDHTGATAPMTTNPFIADGGQYDLLDKSLTGTERGGLMLTTDGNPVMEADISGRLRPMAHGELEWSRADELYRRRVFPVAVTSGRNYQLPRLAVPYASTGQGPAYTPVGSGTEEWTGPTQWHRSVSPVVLFRGTKSVPRHFRVPEGIESLSHHAVARAGTSLGHTIYEVAGDRSLSGRSNNLCQPLVIVTRSPGISTNVIMSTDTAVVSAQQPVIAAPTAYIPQPAALENRTVAGLVAERDLGHTVYYSQAVRPTASVCVPHPNTRFTGDTVSTSGMSYGNPWGVHAETGNRMQAEAAQEPFVLHPAHDSAGVVCQSADACGGSRDKRVIEYQSGCSGTDRRRPSECVTVTRDQRPISSATVPGTGGSEDPDVPGMQLNKYAQRAATTSRKTRDIMKPQSFDGREVFNSFLAHFEVCATFNEWTDAEKLLWLQWALKGRAQQVLWDLAPGQMSSYNDVVQALRQRFGSEHQSELFRVELRNRRRRPHESLSELMQDIRRLMVLAYSSTSSEMWESVAINAFLEALDDPVLSLEVRKRAPTTLDAALKDALLLDGFTRAVSNKTDRDRSRKDQARAVKGPPTPIAAERDEDKTSSWQKELLQSQREIQQQLLRQNEQLLKLMSRENFQQPNSVSARKTDDSAIPGATRPTVAQSDTTTRPALSRRRIRCFICSEEGHIARECPQKGSGRDAGADPGKRSEGTDTKSTANRYIAGASSAYLPATIDGRKCWCLLDTGSEVTVVPSRCVGCNEVTPTTQKLNAANGSEIEIEGETVLDIYVEDIKIKTRCLVSNYVDEIMLGLRWLEDNKCMWNFASRTISIQGREFVLFAHKPSWSVRRIVVQDPVVLPPFSQTNVKSRFIYSSLAKTPTDWVTIPKSIDHGLRVARTVVKDQPTDVWVPVANTTAKVARLEKDKPLTGLEEVSCTGSVTEDGGIEEDTGHIRSVLDAVDDSVSHTDKDRLWLLLRQYSTVFSKGEYDLGRATQVKHKIDTGLEKPVRQALRRQPYHVQKQVDDQLEQMQKQGIISPSQSEWASNLVVVKKKDGSSRICVDYRQLNDKTAKDSYPLPNIDGCLDALGGANWFSTSDLRSGYYQVEVDPVDRPKTTFITRRGAFAFNVMPFGLCNAPATFQRLMDCVMFGLNFETCLVYLDDIIVFSADIDSHLQRLKLLFERLKLTNLKLKPSKCKLIQRSVKFLGYVVSDEGLSTDPDKVEAVANWPTPVKLREVRGFLGLCGYYRRFVRQFSDIAAPLHAMTKKNRVFEWTADCQKAFNMLKTCLVSSPVLSLPRDGGGYILDTDASEHGIGAVLSQVQDGEERVLAYASRLFSDAEKNYCVTRKELLAVTYYLRHFRQYLLGWPFTIRTDHAALQWLRRTPEPIGQQARWLEITEEFDFTIQHRPGRKHTNADSMSRRPCRQCGLCSVNDNTEVSAIRAIDLNSLGWQKDELAREQASDADLAKIYELKQNGSSKPPWSEFQTASLAAKVYCSLWDSIEVHENVLYRSVPAGGGRPALLQLIVPATKRDEVMQKAHAGFTGGHMRERRTMDQVKRRAYWHGWTDDVRQFCRTCETCARYFRGKLPHRGAFQPMVTMEPWERVGVDIIGPFPKSAGGHIYALTIVDYFTKYADAFPIRNQEASTIVKILMERVFGYYGVPREILTDQGRNFESNLFTRMCQFFGVGHVRTSGYKPSTNGLVERLHRTINSMTGKVVSTNQRDWHECLPPAMAAYRATVHETTKYSPNYMLFGRELKTPLDLLVCGPPKSVTETSVDSYIDERFDRIAECYSLVRDHLNHSAQHTKLRYDLHVREAEYAVGDEVWYYCPRRRPGLSPKWQRYYDGPFAVIEVLGPVNYKIRKSPRGRVLTVHVDKLKPYLVRRDEPSDVNHEQAPALAERDSSARRLRPRGHLKPPRRYCRHLTVVPVCRSGMERSFNCDRCGEVYHTRNALRVHLRQHYVEPGRGRMVVLPECDNLQQQQTVIPDHEELQRQEATMEFRFAWHRASAEALRRDVGKVASQLRTMSAHLPRMATEEVIGRLRREPPANRIRHDMLTSIITTARCFSAAGAISCSTQTDAIELWNLLPPPPHPEGRRESCRLCQAPSEPMATTTTRGVVRRRRVVRRSPSPAPRSPLHLLSSAEIQDGIWRSYGIREYKSPEWRGPVGDLNLSDPPLGSFSPDDGAGGEVADSRPRHAEITYWPPTSIESDLYYANRLNAATAWTPNGEQFRPEDIVVPPRRRLPAYLTANILMPVPVTSSTNRTPRRRRHSEVAEDCGIRRCGEEQEPQDVELCELMLPDNDDFE